MFSFLSYVSENDFYHFKDFYAQSNYLLELEVTTIC